MQRLRIRTAWAWYRFLTAAAKRALPPSWQKRGAPGPHATPNVPSFFSSPFPPSFSLALPALSLLFTRRSHATRLRLPCFFDRTGNVACSRDAFRTDEIHGVLVIGWKVGWSEGSRRQCFCGEGSVNGCLLGHELKSTLRDKSGDQRCWKFRIKLVKRSVVMDKRICDWKDVLDVLQVRMMEERLVKGEYCLSTSGVGSPPHSLPSTSGTQNDKIEDVHCACISKLETQVEEQVMQTNLNVSSERNIWIDLPYRNLVRFLVASACFRTSKNSIRRTDLISSAILQNQYSDNLTRLRHDKTTRRIKERVR